MDLDGARMRYLRAGSGPPLILLHGLMGYSFSWRYAMPALAPYATVYAPDLLGAGFSERPQVDHSMRATALRVLQFAQNLRLTSFDLLGTSRGGAVAMCAAAECVDRGEPASAKVGAGRAGQSVFGAWQAAGSVLRQPDGFGAGSVGDAEHAVSLSLLARAVVWRPKQDSAGQSGRLQGATRDSWIVRACAEHRQHMDRRSAGTGGAVAEAGCDSHALDVGKQRSGGVRFVDGATLETFYERANSNVSGRRTFALRRVSGGVQPGADQVPNGRLTDRD